MTPIGDNADYKRAMIAAHLREFQCETNRLVPIIDGLDEEERARIFHRMVREYSWVIGNEKVRNDQILRFFKLCQRLATVTGQAEFPSAPPTKIPRKLREAIKARYEYTCCYCGGKGTRRVGPDGQRWHIDHIQPKSRAGTDDEANLALACGACNSSKHDMTADEFFALATAHVR